MRAAGLPAETPWATAKLPDGTRAQGGIVLYGAPIGDDAFVRAYLAAAIDEAKAGLKRLSYLETNQHKLIMLRMSFCRKVQHIQRLVPTSQHEDLLRDYDGSLVAAVEDLMVGRGRFTELAATKVHLPAALGGLGVESATARADACYYSSLTCAYHRLAALDPDWVGSVCTAAAAGRHAPSTAYAAAKARLGTTPGMSALLEKLTVHDRPRRAQGKIMNLKYAVEVEDLIRRLPPREVTVIHASADASHLVSISAGGDPSLQVTNDVLATHLAMRLSVSQTYSSPSTGAANKTHHCRACGKHHLNEHLDGLISCGPGGTALRTPWHDDIGRVFHRTATCVGIPSVREPAGIAVDSNIRTDLKLSSVSARHADAYLDVVTYEHTQDSTWDKEALLPGIFCDRAERFKHGKHNASVVASDARNDFYPVAVNEYSQLGPQGMDVVDIIVSRSHDPVALKTYMLRQLAVVTANHVHHHLHGRLRGHVSLRPAAERAADPERHTPVADDVTEQTIDADDAMVIEERQRGAAAATGTAAGQRRARQAELARDGVAGEAASGGTAADVARGVGGRRWWAWRRQHFA